MVLQGGDIRWRRKIEAKMTDKELVRTALQKNREQEDEEAVGNGW
jgi:hypothetical protein